MASSGTAGHPLRPFIAILHADVGARDIFIDIPGTTVKHHPFIRGCETLGASKKLRGIKGKSPNDPQSEQDAWLCKLVDKANAIRGDLEPLSGNVGEPNRRVCVKILLIFDEAIANKGVARVVPCCAGE
jgi:hypothetical protein